jgi:hypothetical protein
MDRVTSFWGAHTPRWYLDKGARVQSYWLQPVAMLGKRWLAVTAVFAET